MKIFAIRDENDKLEKDLAYLLYYEKEKAFYIELPENADPWKIPLLLSSFAQRRIKTVNAYWSKLWVQQRIVPMDRQNLGQILRDNGLKEYDEFQLLMLADGRCEQDDYYLVSISKEELYSKMHQRFEHKVEDVIPLEEYCLLVFFRDGMVKKCDAKEIVGEDKQFSPVLTNPEIFCEIVVQTGGHGIAWGVNHTISDETLYQTGESVPLSMNDFKSFIKNRIVSTKEATEMLDCSRQNIDDLVKRDKLHPVKVDAKNKLFLKTEIEQRNWQ